MDFDTMADLDGPPPKKPRLETQQCQTLLADPDNAVDDMDDLYGTPPAIPGSPIRNAPKEVMSTAPTLAHHLPGLGLNGNLTQYPVSNDTNTFKTPFLETNHGGVTNGQKQSSDFDGAQPDQALTEGGEMGTLAAIIQGTDTAMSEAQRNIPNASNVLIPEVFSHHMGLMPGSPKVGESSEVGLRTAESKSNAPFLSQPLGSRLQESSEANGVSPKQEPTSGIPETSKTHHERVDDSYNINGIDDMPPKADLAHDVPPIASLTTEPLAPNTGKGPDDGEQPLKAEADPSTTLKELPEADGMDGEPEFEIDSSPIESSSSDTSTDSSSSDDSDDDYQMLDPEEEARRLMQEDMGSDGEGAGKGVKGTGIGHVRTLNEKPDAIVERPNVIVTADMKIEELGNVENLVDNLALIKAKISGEYQVLETGSVLCLGDRTVIGVIAETLGRVQQPFYSVCFTNAAAIIEIGIFKGTKIFYVQQHSTYVFTQAIKAIKGSDASNLHDEEVGDDELEFSDDEAEAEHKRRVKMQRQSKRDTRTGDRDGFTRGPQQRGRGNRGGRGGRGGNGFRDRDIQDRVRDFNIQHQDAGGINYDEKSDGDDLYTPLARPSNLHEMMSLREAPLESTNVTENNFRGARGNRGRGDRGRGRGDRGRGRGGRGDGRDRGIFGRNGSSDRQPQRSYSPPGLGNGFHSPSQANTEHSSYPQYNGYRPHSPPQNNTFAPPAPYPQQPALPYQPTSQFYSQAPNPPSQYTHAYTQGYPQPQYQPPQSFPPQHQQQPPPQHYYPTNQPQLQYSSPQQYNRPAAPPTPSNIPPGAYVNPAFFAGANAFGSAGRGPEGSR